MGVIVGTSSTAVASPPAPDSAQMSTVYPLDNEMVETALTRGEIMRSRGYGDDDSDRAETMVPPIVLVPEPEAPRCAVCQSVIPPKRLVRFPNCCTCGDRCSKQRLRERQKRYDARWRSSDNRKAATVTVINGSVETSAPVANATLERTSTPSPVANATPSLVAVVQQLAGNGLHLRLVVEGVELEVTQR